MLDYVPLDFASVVGQRKKTLHRIDIDDTKSLLSQDDELLPPEEGLDESTASWNQDGYQINHDITDLSKESEIPMIPDSEDGSPDTFLDDSPDEHVHYIPSDIIDYYNESAMKASQRNKLPDDAFGLPRLRAYPLHDEKHVRQAVRMFGHCKDPNDRKILAGNIVKRINEFDLDITIGKTNPLYTYLPKTMQESSLEQPIQVYGLEKVDEEKTREEIIQDHLRMNSMFYHLMFYGDSYVNSVKCIESFSFFDYFYPNFKSFNLYTRLKTSIGGIGMQEDIYEMLQIRYALCTDFTDPLGNINLAETEDTISLYLISEYNIDANWLKVDCYDSNHIVYCLRLYSILGDIMLNPYFQMSNLTDVHIGILLDWSQRVLYHYDLLQDCEENTEAYYKEAQYLHDLLWFYEDNPLNPDMVVSNIISMLHIMACAKEQVLLINETDGMYNKTDCTKYLINQLGFDDDMFLLPGTLEYPVINKNSVRLAMDMITRISKDQIEEFSKNLNRKYKELGCTFSITVDHPYARYASSDIVDNMTCILAEASSVVDDDSSDTTNMYAGDYWYARQDLADREGMMAMYAQNTDAITKTKTVSPDYTRAESIL